jgi:hypothetical protein
VTYLLGQKGHRKCLVKQSEFPVLALLVIWIPEDATIEQRSMYISDHASDVSCGIRRFAGWRVFDAVKVVDGRGVEVQRIPLIERVNFAARWNLDIRVGEDELAQRRVERVTIDAVTCGKNKVCRRAVPGETWSS